MSGPVDMNIIIGQGSTVKEVHNVKKQNLEINQQFSTQITEDMKKDNQSKVQESEKENRIEDKKEKENKEKQKDNKKRSKDDTPEEKIKFSENSLIDIRV